MPSGIYQQDSENTELGMSEFWAFQSLLKGVFTLVEDLLVISEIIYYFGFRLYAGTFVAFHYIRYLFYSILVRSSMNRFMMVLI